jgi:hypothetical protein
MTNVAKLLDDKQTTSHDQDCGKPGSRQSLEEEIARTSLIPFVNPNGSVKDRKLHDRAKDLSSNMAGDMVDSSPSSQQISQGSKLFPSTDNMDISLELDSTTLGQFALENYIDFRKDWSSAPETSGADYFDWTEDLMSSDLPSLEYGWPREEAGAAATLTDISSSPNTLVDFNYAFSGVDNILYDMQIPEDYFNYDLSMSSTGVAKSCIDELANDLEADCVQASTPVPRRYSWDLTMKDHAGSIPQPQDEENGCFFSMSFKSPDGSSFNRCGEPDLSDKVSHLAPVTRPIVEMRRANWMSLSSTSSHASVLSSEDAFLPRSAAFSRVPTAVFPHVSTRFSMPNQLLTKDIPSNRLARHSELAPRDVLELASQHNLDSQEALESDRSSGLIQKGVISMEKLTSLLRDSNLTLTGPTEQVYRPKDEPSMVDIILLDDAESKITPALNSNALRTVLKTSRSKVRLIHSVCRIDVESSPGKTPSDQSFPSTVPPAPQTSSPAMYRVYDQAHTLMSQYSHLEYIRSISDHVSPTPDPNGERLITIIYRSMALGTVIKCAMVAPVELSELSPPASYSLRWLDPEWRTVESMISDLHTTNNLIPCAFNGNQPVDPRGDYSGGTMARGLACGERGRQRDFISEMDLHLDRAATQSNYSIMHGSVEIDKAVVYARRARRLRVGALFEKPVDAVKALWLVYLALRIDESDRMC